VIVGFGTAAGKDYFLGASAEEHSNLFARSFDRGARALAGCVDGCSVTEIGGEIGEHGVEDCRFDGGGGVVI
jgi:hypothetical protein